MTPATLQKPFGSIDAEIYDSGNFPSRAPCNDGALPRRLEIAVAKKVGSLPWSDGLLPRDAVTTQASILPRLPQSEAVGGILKRAAAALAIVVAHASLAAGYSALFTA